MYYTVYGWQFGILFAQVFINIFLVEFFCNNDTGNGNTNLGWIVENENSCFFTCTSDLNICCICTFTVYSRRFNIWYVPRTDTWTEYVLYVCIYTVLQSLPVNKIHICLSSRHLFASNFFKFLNGIHTGKLQYKYKLKIFQRLNFLGLHGGAVRRGGHRRPFLQLSHQKRLQRSRRLLSSGAIITAV